eukprot:scaffold94414_cov69-Phaeocystis_antarctica.AAC.8
MAPTYTAPRSRRAAAATSSAARSHRAEPLRCRKSRQGRPLRMAACRPLVPRSEGTRGAWPKTGAPHRPRTKCCMRQPMAPACADLDGQKAVKSATLAWLRVV